MAVTSEELNQIVRELFETLDKDKSGTLEPEEFFDIPGKTLGSYVGRVGAEPVGQASYCRSG